MKTVCPVGGEFDEQFYSHCSGVGLLIRSRCAQGLHSNLASGSLMGFCGSFMLASESLFQEHLCSWPQVVLSGMKNTDIVHLLAVLVLL